MHCVAGYTINLVLALLALTSGMALRPPLIWPSAASTPRASLAPVHAVQRTASHHSSAAPCRWQSGGNQVTRTSTSRITITRAGFVRVRMTLRGGKRSGMPEVLAVGRGPLRLVHKVTSIALATFDQDPPLPPNKQCASVPVTSCVSLHDGFASSGRDPPSSVNNHVHKLAAATMT